LVFLDHKVFYIKSVFSQKSSLPITAASNQSTITLVTLILFQYVTDSFSTRFTIVNNCNYTVWPEILFSTTPSVFRIIKIPHQKILFCCRRPCFLHHHLSLHLMRLVGLRFLTFMSWSNRRRELHDDIW